MLGGGIIDSLELISWLLLTNYWMELAVINHIYGYRYPQAVFSPDQAVIRYTLVVTGDPKQWYIHLYTILSHHQGSINYIQNIISHIEPSSSYYYIYVYC